MAGFYTIFFLVTLYVEEVLHYSAIHAGLCYLPVTVGAGEALTLGFQRGLLGASIALVIAAVIALRAPNMPVADMAPGADDNQSAVPIPLAG